VLPALRRMLLEPSALTGAPDRPQGRRGCLVGNTTAELVPGDEEARALAAAASDGFIEVVTVALARARRRERSRRARPPRSKRGCCCSSSRARPWCRAPNPATSASPPASTPHSTRYASADLPMWPFSSVRAAGLGKVLAAQREVPACGSPHTARHSRRRTRVRCPTRRPRGRQIRRAIPAVACSVYPPARRAGPFRSHGRSFTTYEQFRM